MKIFLPLFFILSCLLLGACNTYEKMVYFQEVPSSGDSLSVSKTYSPSIKVDDFLAITVLADDPNSTIPFNLPTPSQSQVGGYTNGVPSPLGYLVDENGMINMPVLGPIDIGGLSRVDATEKIRKLLLNYLQNPVVNIRIQNFKITVLGEVSRPGTFQIPNERITILEAIGLAGDLRPTGIRKNIRIIRDVDGTKKQYVIDLTKVDFLDSEVYYLQQNDVVYVEPNSASRYGSTIIPSVAPVVISITSLLISTAALILR